MTQQQPSRFSDLWGIYLSSRGANESTIQETERISIRTRAVLQLIQGFFVAVSFTVTVLGLGMVLIAGTKERPWGWAESLMIIGGIGLALGFGFVCYNQARSIFEPYWRRSPFEQAMIKMMPLMFGMEDLPAQLEVRRVPVVRQGGKIPEYEAEHVQEAKVMEPGLKYGTIDPELGNLIWFVLYASGLRDLSYSTLILEPAPMLPFKEPDSRGRNRSLRLRKRLIATLLERGEKRGWFIVPGSGKPASWPNNRRQPIIDLALNDWRMAMGDSPPPEYWRNDHYVTMVKLDD